jgi:hypothetical protein
MALARAPLAAAQQRPQRRASAPNGLLAVMLGLALVVVLPWWRPADPLTGRVGLLTYAPSGLALALRDAVKPGDRVFAPQLWDSWFEWAVPDARYFVDARFELFPGDVWSDLDAIDAGGTPADVALVRRGVRVVVVDASQAALGDQLVAAGWVQAFTDADGRVLLAPATTRLPG